MTKQRLTASAAVLFAFAALSTVARAEIFEQILVKVNGEIFTKSDLESRQVLMLRQRGDQVDPKATGNQQLRRVLDEITPRIMVDAVDEMLVVQRGRELGYKLSDEQFNTILSNIRRENKIETDEQFQAALKQENMTPADLRRNLERQMIAQRVQQNEVFGRVAVTEEEARTYYNSHMNEFTTLPTVTLREILIAVPSNARGVNVAEDEAARERIDAVRERAAKGEDFAKLAETSSDSSSKTNGGLLGPLSMKDLSPDLQKLIGAMKPGDVTQPLRTPRGYQILKLETSTKTVVMAFDQAREQISDRVFTDKRKDEFEKYLQKLRSQAIIDWRNQDVKRAWEEGLKQQRAAVAGPAASAQ
jgi:peptidyl-prolyl cis-trans isomerase SurA